MYENLPMNDVLVRAAWYFKSDSQKAEETDKKFKHLCRANDALLHAGYMPPEEDLQLALHYFLTMNAEGL